MKIFVAIPVYDGKLPVETARAILQEQSIATGGGDEFITAFLPNCSHAGMGRNQLAQMFLDSGSDRLVFLDADVTFAPGSIIRIAKHKVDFVGGAYRYKMPKEDYPIGWLPVMRGIPLDDKSALLEVGTVPGGFLSLSRDVFSKIRKSNPGRSYEHFGRIAEAFFQMNFMDGRLYGEDAFFCKSWRDLGGKIYLDPELSLTHWDFNKPYPGHVGNWLKRRTQIAGVV